MAREVFELTQAGLEELREELTHRKVHVRPEIGQQLQLARSFGDLSENSEYDAAREAQAANEARIKQLEKILNNAKVIQESSIDYEVVGLGTQVKVLDIEFNEESTFILVSATEENVLEDKYSQDSPVGQAILGKRKGDEVAVQAPAGIFNYRILDVSKPRR